MEMYIERTATADIEPDAFQACGYLEERDWKQDDGFCQNCGAKMDGE